MRLLDVVLFLHIATVLAAFLLSGVMHASEVLARRATTVEQLRLVTAPQKLAPLFGPILLVLVGFGAWLITLNDEGFSVRDGWVWSAIVAVVVLAADGPLVMGRHAKALATALADRPSGPLTPELRELASASVPSAVGWMNTLLALGVVLNMSTKPSSAVAVVDLAVAAALGALLGAQLARTREVEVDAAPATAG